MARTHSRGSRRAPTGSSSSPLCTATSAHPVTVPSAAAASGIDAAVVAAPGGLGGSVAAASTKAAIQGATVSVYDLGGSVVGSATTDGSGAYTVSGLAPGSYRVAFAVPGHVSQYYNGKPSLASADPVTVTADSTTAGINAALTANPQRPLPPVITQLSE